MLTATLPTAEHLHVVRSARDNVGYSELLLYVAPHYFTPKHFHDLFDECFEVVAGELEFGHGNQKVVLRAGEQVTVGRGTVHYFANRTAQSAVVRVKVSPGNPDFELGFLIYHGLIRDQLVDQKRRPKHFADTAIFLKLTNSRFPGLGRFIEPLFFRAARKAIARGRLAEMHARYAVN
ncbi:cupin domain-containing protein [Hymenobacter sp. 15J16-1T3B]|uniref:cupin domain-containing protein n=1 Tax=Hymenobacter sp. 15J16-1T3B TaxID=2886941 RepID=UPI001D111C14|nr:cupin domain-containing protein [Hymenobacter sp. 15J16-1T3B]MCC3160334.1 cupin domain-containing protein [Hymenobacter sp. 15J16-1T3B]